MNLVNAQQARRILDRIVGFELSPVLWRKMSMKNNLSAGRVQSVAVRIIAEREREINAFTPDSTFRVEAIFTSKDISGKQVSFSAEGKKHKDAGSAEAFLQSCINADYTVADIQVNRGKKRPQLHSPLLPCNRKRAESWDIPFRVPWCLRKNYMKAERSPTCVPTVLT